MKPRISRYIFAALVCTSIIILTAILFSDEAWKDSIVLGAGVVQGVIILRYNFLLSRWQSRQNK